MINQKMYELGSNGSIIRELAAYGSARAAEIGPENVFDFTIGNPSLPLPDEITRTAVEILTKEDPISTHSYTSAAGDHATRLAIAKDLNARFGLDVTPEELIIGCGSSQELVGVFYALAVPGAEFLTVAPYFPEYKVYVEQCGGIFKAVPADIPNFQINLDKLAEMINPNTVALILNSPNNPSGVVYTRKTLNALADLLRQKSAQFGHPIYIVADEPYRELAYDGVEVPFIPTIYADTIVCYSYSKCLSLPGERIGYIYIPQNTSDGAALHAAITGGVRVSGHICAPSLWQKVLARCAHVQPDLTSYDQNRKALYQGLLDAGYEAAKPDGAFYLFVKAPGGDATAFCKKAMEKDLLVVPGDDFGCPGYFRLCYCVDHDKILRSLPVFKSLI